MCLVRSPLFAAAVLLVPAALGLNLGVSAAERGSLNGIGQYGASADQVTSITQFSDVQPTDWAYQALRNLIERYGCVAGYPNCTYRGSRAMTRFEAAALLNACLDRITEVTDELKRLMKEFEMELAVLKGRVDGLEAKVAELEATQFSTTTKLSGLATFVVGANTFTGSAINRGANTANRNSAYSPTFVLPNATTFNYDVQLNVDTSFTGNDLLRTTLRSGNFDGDNNSFGGAGSSGLSQLEVAFQEEGGPNVVGIDRLFYQFPLGDFTFTLGGRVAQEDMLALWPSVYPADTILNVMTVNGAPAAYSKNLGAGAGAWWQQGGFSISANYVASNGQSGNPSVPVGEGGGGIGNKFSGATGSVQLAYQQEQWGLAAIWNYVQPDTQFVPGTTPFTHGAIDHNVNAKTNALGLSAYWQPLESGWWPSVSIGWGINSTSYSVPQPAGSLSTSQSWMVGLQWTDVFQKGNDFGFAVAQPVFATALTGGVTPNDGNYVWEWWYKFQVTDKISVTPALIYLSRPLGQQTPAGESFSQFGGLVKTSFRF
ncbi:MAG: porin [Cyanobacteria bacterium K_DeepCast_150m_m2_101]|nr:porin [Cyanobacteria bacterium K_DeepCast_150m_m2_101]